MEKAPVVMEGLQFADPIAISQKTKDNCIMK